MSDDCHHAPPPRRGIGIARDGEFDPVAFERAVEDLLRACGVAIDGAHTGKTSARVRELWQRRLLGGYEGDPAEALGEGFEDPRTIGCLFAASRMSPICRGVGCMDSAASRAWSTSLATALPIRNG